MEHGKHWSGKFAWKPHIKSGNVLWLAIHLADISSWATWTIKEDSMYMAPGGISLPQPPQVMSVSELLDRFDANVAEARLNSCRVPGTRELGKTMVAVDEWPDPVHHAEGRMSANMGAEP